MSVLHGGNYKITLKDGKGNLLCGEKIIFNLNGKNIVSLITGSYGAVSVKIPKKLHLGNDNLKISLDGSYYNKISKEVNIKVIKEKLSVNLSKNLFKVKSRNKKLTLTLRDSNSKLLKRLM